MPEIPGQEMILPVDQKSLDERKNREDEALQRPRLYLEANSPSESANFAGAGFALRPK